MVAAGRTAAPEHVLATDALRALAVEVDPAGLILGQDSAGRPVPVRLFRPEPTAVTLVGGRWAAQVLVFRCLAVGATVVVRHDPQWMALDRPAGGGRVRALTGPADQLGPLAAHASRPVLYVSDGSAARPALPGWQTRLTVLPRVTPDTTHLLSGADLVLAQRLGDPDLRLAADALALDAPTMAMLRSAGPDTVVALQPGNERYVWLAPTAIERELFGEP